MTIEFTQAYFVDEGLSFSLSQLTQQSGLSEEEIQALVESGAFSPADPRAAYWRFDAHCVIVARNARRVRDEFALADAHSLAVVLRLLQRIQTLEENLKRLGER